MIPTTTLPTFISTLAAAGYAPTPRTALTVTTCGGRAFIFDVIEFKRNDTTMTVFVHGSGATVAEALERARVKVLK